jgi:hypothetical protein
VRSVIAGVGGTDVAVPAAVPAVAGVAVASVSKNAVAVTPGGASPLAVGVALDFALPPHADAMSAAMATEATP